MAESMNLIIIACTTFNLTVSNKKAELERLKFQAVSVLNQILLSYSCLIRLVQVFLI